MGKLIKYSDMIDEVAIFHAPKTNRWIVRQFCGLGRSGDCFLEHEPSDEELKEVFGEQVNIVREYAIVSTQAADMIGEKIREANWIPDPHKIIGIYNKNRETNA